MYLKSIRFLDVGVISFTDKEGEDASCVCQIMEQVESYNLDL